MSFNDYWDYEESNESKKELMGIFSDVFKFCRNDNCHNCKYRHGEKNYSMLQCMGERFCEYILSNGYGKIK